MFEKMGTTLASQYEVHIIGQPGRQYTASDRHTDKVLTDQPNRQHGAEKGDGGGATWSLNAGLASMGITWHPLPSFSRLHVRRLIAPWRVFAKVLTLQPAVFIVCTAELLPIALLVRLFSSARIIYDVQENYAMNIRLGSVWPRMLRPFLARCVRTLEWCGAMVVSRFLLAEESYARELTFIRDHYDVIENKFIDEVDVLRNQIPDDVAALRDQSARSGVKPTVTRSLRLLFTGTLADSTGVFIAIELAKLLHKQSSDVELHIIGYAAQQSVRDNIKRAAAHHPFIKLTGIDHLVPHQNIRSAITTADFGIISYPPNESTWHSYPTKLYEYLAMRLPILLIDNPKWTSYCNEYAAAVVFPPEAHLVNASDLLARMQGQHFYRAAPDQVYWSSEAPKLLRAVSETLSKV